MVGAIDYQTGDFTILALGQYSYPDYTIRSASKSGYIYKLSSTYASKNQTFNGDVITAIPQASDLNHTQHSESISSSELTIDLLPAMNDTVLLPGSVIFEWNGETYYDRNGSLYKNLSTETNAGVQVIGFCVHGCPKH